MRRKLAVGIGVVLVVVALLLWWRSRGGDGGGGGGAHGAGSAVAAAKHADGARASSIKDRSKLAPARLSGRVTRKADGGGVAGAVVSVATGELLPKFLMAQERPTRIAVTDASGAWSLDHVTPGAYRVAATAKGLLPGELPKLAVAAGEDRRGVDLALVAGGTLVSGTVSDVGGGPVADARITAVQTGVRELQAGADFVTTTGADGRYELTLPRGELRLTATHDDYAKGSREVEIQSEPLTVDFSLVPGASIHGTVVERDSGKPVSGGAILAQGNGRGRGGGDGLTTVDTDGTFVVRGLTAGDVELTAIGPGYATASPTVVPVGVGEQVEDVEVLVDRAYSISGRVVRAGTTPAEGLPGVTLGAFSIASQAFGFSLEPSAEDGAFEIVGLKKGNYNLFAVGEGSVPDVGKPAEIVDRDLTGVIVELDAGVTISGRVEPPVAKVEVSIAPAVPIGFANMFDAAKSILVHDDTDDTGAFVLRNVPAGAFKLTARAEDGRTGVLPIVVAQVEQTGLVVALAPRASISGRVVDTHGKPVRDRGVHSRSLGGDDQRINFDVNGRRGAASTRSDGAFTLVGLDPGEYEVRADDGELGFVAADKQDAIKSRARVTLAAGEAKTGVVLTVEARDGVIRGVVIAPDGKPAADAWVTANRAIGMPDGVPAKYARYYKDHSDPVLTGDDGRFTIAELRAGTYTVEVDGPRGASHAAKPDVKPGDNVTIKLLSLGSITGKVTAGGAPVTKFDIECDGEKPGKQHVEAADGAYTVARLPPGAYTCEVTSDIGTGEGRVDVATEPAHLDITLARWATVTGVIVDVVSKQPVAGVIAMVSSQGAGNGQAFASIVAGKAPTSDPTGRFTVERVAVGKGNVALMPKDSFTPLGTREFTAVEGQRIDVGTIEIVKPRTGDAGTFGLGTEIDGDKLMVASVAEGGPAQAAGVLVGDRITAIDGRDVATLTLPIAKTLLSSGMIGVGETAALTLDRAGTSLQVSVTSAKW